MLIFRTPTLQHQHQVVVWISRNGQQYIPHLELTFRYYADPQMISISPMSGPTMGDSLVNLTALNLTQGSELTCKFGNSVTKGVVRLHTSKQVNYIERGKPQIISRLLNN